LLAGVNEARRDRRAAAHERQRNADNERSRREDERHALQRDTLIALQEDIQHLLRHAGRTLHFDHMQARNGEYTLLPEGWGDEELATRMSLKRHAAQILDPDVRAAVHDLSTSTARVTSIPTHFMNLAGDELEAAALDQINRLNALADGGLAAVEVALRREIAWEPAAPEARVPAS
jgi:hypothetical protein